MDVRVVEIGWGVDAVKLFRRRLTKSSFVTGSSGREFLRLVYEDI